MQEPAAPIVSVVIPVRNREDLLARAVQSVANQTFPGIEIVIVDDASEPALRTPEPVGRGDMQVVRNASRTGTQCARLIGVQAARGYCVALLDSDDWWTPEKIERQMASLSAGEADLISSRVTVVRGSFKRIAPRRPLRPTERVEDFLYVGRGMLQSSTILAPRQTLIDLLGSTVNSRVHTDTVLFLEAQRRGLRIVQLPEALSCFDDAPRPDRMSYDPGRVAASEAWYRAVSPDWSLAARRGFMLIDMVPRFVNTGQRWKALACLLSAYHPSIGLTQYIKKLAYILFNGSPSASLKRINDRMRKPFHGKRIF